MKTLLHLCRCVLGLDRPHSQVTAAEQALLVAHARDAKVIVELGCYEGSTSVALARSTRGDIYSVDLFPKGRIGICYGEWIARLHRWRSRAYNVTFLRGLTHHVASKFHETIDVLFVDADHSFEGAKRDWEDWFPKVKAGGVIALHDCKQAPNSPNYLGSMKLYDEVLRSMEGIEELGSVDSLVLFRVKQ